MKVVIVFERGTAKGATVVVDGPSPQAVTASLLEHARRAAANHHSVFRYQAHQMYLLDLMQPQRKGTEVPEELAIPVPGWSPQSLGKFVAPAILSLDEWLASVHPQAQ